MQILYNHEDIVKMLSDARKGKESCLCRNNLTECHGNNDCIGCCFYWLEQWFKYQEYERIENYLEHLITEESMRCECESIYKA